MMSPKTPRAATTFQLRLRVELRLKSKSGGSPKKLMVRFLFVKRRRARRGRSMLNVMLSGKTSRGVNTHQFLRAFHFAPG
jgi:hypothetical protein